MRAQPLALVALVLAAFALAAVRPPSASADALADALGSGELTEPQYALARASSLFDLAAVRRRFPGAERPDPHSATLLLRELRLALPALERGERVAAARLLARPGTPPARMPAAPPEPDETIVCGAHVCLHWSPGTPTAPPATDADRSGVPDWGETTLAVLEEVWWHEVERLGYRAPLPTATGDPRLQVYLDDIGDDGLFGYCTTDDPGAELRAQVSAFCVLENDFRDAGLGGVAPLAALRVTAAHEFFHAVQFAYDWLEDAWFMEGTATWIEDEVYDGVDDNRRYLDAASPLARPEVALDHGRGGFEYGAWIFWRYLSERHGAGVVRDVWNRAASGPDGSNPYSLTALDGALGARGVAFDRLFAGWSAANRIPRRRYAEGGAYPVARVERIGNRSPLRAGGWRIASVSHLASRVVSFRPTRASRRLRLALAPTGHANARASVVVVGSSGAAAVVSLPGGGSRVVRFDPRRVRRVDLVLTNAGSRYACWRGTSLACRGLPLDDGRTFRFRAVAR